MGNGPARGWPPIGVVTIVLAGGRIEEFKKPILAGDIMLRHPRHHVVRPDLFRSSPMVVLRPEEVLLPGHKFFLVPFHTVHKKLTRRVEVLHKSSTSSSAAPPAPAPALDGGALGTIRDINSCRHGSGCTQCSVRIGQKGLARAATVTRSPAVRTSVSRKSSPRTSLQARKTLLHKEFTRNSRKKPVDSCDYARRRTSLQSQLARHSTGTSADLAELESFWSADFAGCISIPVQLPVTKQAPSSDLSVPEYESFKKFSGEPSFQPTVPAGKKRESVEALDSSGSKTSSIEPLLPTTPTSVKELIHLFESSTSEKPSPSAPIGSKAVTPVEEPEWFEAMDCSETEKSSGEPQLRTPVPVPDGNASVLAMKERMISRSGDSGLHHRTRKQDLSRFNKPPRPPSSLEREFMQKKVTLKVAAEAQQANSHGDRQNSSRRQPTSGQKQVVTQEPERRSTGRSEQRVPQQQHEMKDKSGNPKERQQILKEAGNDKFMVKPLDKGPSFKSPQVGSKPLTPTSPVPVKKPSVTLVKQRKPYRHKLIEHLCFSSAKYLQSPLHVQAAGNPEKQMKAHQLKLSDHLKLELSPPPQYLQKLFQQSPLNAQATADVNNSPRRHYKLPAPPTGNGSGSGSRMDPKAQKDLVAFQLNQAVKSQWDPSVLRPNNVNQTVKTSVEEKFLKVPPVGFFRHRRIRSRRRIHRLANWKPKLSPLVEFSP